MCGTVEASTCEETERPYLTCLSLKPTFFSEGTALPACFNIFLFYLGFFPTTKDSTVLFSLPPMNPPQFILIPVPISWLDIFLNVQWDELKLHTESRIILIICKDTAEETVFLCTCVCAPLCLPACAFFISDLGWFTQARCEDCCNGVSAAYWFHDEQMMSL